MIWYIWGSLESQIKCLQNIFQQFGFSSQFPGENLAALYIPLLLLRFADFGITLGSDRGYCRARLYSCATRGDGRKSYIIMILAVTIMPGILSVCTASDIYKLTDEHGHITYTNTPIKGAKKLQFKGNSFHGKSPRFSNEMISIETPYPIFTWKWRAPSKIYQIVSVEIFPNPVITTG